MLYIHFNNKVPNEKKFEYSIMGNNDTDVIKFDIGDITELDFEPNAIYVKTQTKDKRYVDKIELENEGNVLTWHLLAKTTCHKVIECQLSFETTEKCYQTEIVEITLKPYIDADGTIINDYPTVLQDFEARIEALEQGGGSGGVGVSDVIIKRVFLTYQDSYSLRYGRLMTTRNGELITNDSTRIFVNFETSVIDDKIENEIKNGRFIIRLDYPIRNKGKNHIADRDDYSYLLPAKNMRNCGMGYRSFTYVLSEASDINDHKRTMLVKSFIYVNESDVKTNRYGEKYIHKKVSLIDFINKMCCFDNENYTPIEAFTTALQMQDIFFAYEDRFVNGIPTLQTNGDETNLALYIGSTRAKIFSTSSNQDLIGSRDTKGLKYLTNTIKLNPTFNCYTPTIIRNYQRTPQDGLPLHSEYWTNKKGYVDYYKFENDLVMARLLHNKTNYEYPAKARPYMVTKPRCAILNENYESEPYAFLKSFTQSDQQIRLLCKNIQDIGGVYVSGTFMPIFRILIQPK